MGQQPATTALVGLNKPGPRHRRLPAEWGSNFPGPPVSTDYVESAKESFSEALVGQWGNQAKQLIEFRNTHGPFRIDGLRLGFFGDGVNQEQQRDFQLSDAELKQRLAAVLVAGMAGGPAQP